jgi:poly(A) polymerase
VYDEYNGADDLKNGIIRTPLDPLRTFEDDPLRILRAIRFASRFDFKLKRRHLKDSVQRKTGSSEVKLYLRSGSQMSFCRS